MLAANMIMLGVALLWLIRIDNSIDQLAERIYDLEAAQEQAATADTEDGAL